MNILKIKTFCTSIIVLIILANCSNPIKKKISDYNTILKEAGFDRNSWILDSLGCDPETKSKNAKIFMNQDFITKCTKSDIIEILGKPFKIHKKEKTSELYYITDGRLTCEIFRLQGILVDGDSAFLIISINEKGFLSDTRIIIR
jgi:hypothetical protein